jgi:hypothetical protein
MKESIVKITQGDVKTLLLDTFVYDEADIEFIGEYENNNYSIFEVKIENIPRYVISEGDRILGMYDFIPKYVSSSM